MIPAPRSPADAPLLTPLQPAGQHEGQLGDVSAMALDDLRHQRHLLTEELRGVRYWRRVASAQTDILVASLLYSGHDDIDGLHGGGSHSGGSHSGGSDGGSGGASLRAASARPDAVTRLEGLRERSVRMAAHERALRIDLETVTRELADRVASSLGSMGAAAAG